MDSYSYDTAYRYGNYNKANDFDPTINRWEEEDKGTLTFTDMLTLMVTQFQNQTPDNQADSSDMMNQLVQMSVMQAMNDMTSQMKELALANVMSYAASLVGQTVTVGVWNDETEELEELVGVVKGTGTYNGQQVIYLDNGEGYFLSDIMAVGTLPPKKEEETPGEGEGEGSGEGEDNKTETENEVG